MRTIDHAIASLDTLTTDELDSLPPAQQRRFAELCYHWFAMADRRARKSERVAFRSGEHAATAPDYEYPEIPPRP